MALTTRVWSAGKFFVLAGALLATFVLSFAVSMRIALKTREVVVPDLAGQTVERGHAPAGRGRPHAARSRRPAGVDPKVPAGPDRGAGTAGRHHDAQPAQREGVAQRRPDRVDRARPGRRVRADRADPGADGVAARWRRSPRSAPPTSPPASSSRRTPPPQSRAASVALLVNRGERGRTYVMPDLIGVARRAGRRPAAVARASAWPSSARSRIRAFRPGIVIRQSPQGGFQIAPGDAISLEVSR